MVATAKLLFMPGALDTHALTGVVFSKFKLRLSFIFLLKYERKIRETALIPTLTGRESR
jgi:hypothetical protein